MSWGVSLVVVTGASRGLGACLCRELALRVAPGSVILGTSRSLQDMELQRPLLEARGIKYECLACDLSCPNVAELQAAVTAASTSLQGTCDRAIIVHNAGSLGSLKYMSSITDSQQITSYYSLNISSLFPLNATFLATAKELRKTNPDLAVQVVNISSLTALQPFRTMALYCSGKAARDMIFRVLAAEESSISVLNYAPGPLDTDMHKTIRDECEDEEMKQMFISKKEDNTILSCEQTVTKLLSLLESGTYTSGDHVDYYDIPDKAGHEN